MLRSARHQAVEKPADELPPELAAIVIALAKEAARRDHYAEVAVEQHNGRQRERAGTV